MDWIPFDSHVSRRNESDFAISDEYSSVSEKRAFDISPGVFGEGETKRMDG